MKLPDSNAAKLGAYAVTLVVAFGAGFVLGGAVGPVAADAGSEHSSGGHVEPGMMDEHGMGEHGMDERGMDEEGSAAATLPGLAVSESGYPLVPSASILVAGTATDFSFTVTDLEPYLGEFGTEFPTPGTYRLFAEPPGASRDRTLAGVDRDFKHEGAVHTAEFTVIVSG